jgi:quercetin dioxygenase-like cupin family protein
VRSLRVAPASTIGAMRRHPGLVPLSHDHHHTLSRARELRLAAEAGEEESRAALAGFAAFFRAETARHLREEEELVLPLLAAHAPEASAELVARTGVEHARIRALATGPGEPAAAVAAELGSLLEAHVRMEERELFELLQEAVPEEALAALPIQPREPDDAVVRLLAPAGSGPLWGTETDDLNATLLAWPEGGGSPEHVNDERDVLLVVLEGTGTVELDGEAHGVEAGTAVVLPRGCRRRVAAGPGGLRYLSVHRRRSTLSIAPARRA